MCRACRGNSYREVMPYHLLVVFFCYSFGIRNYWAWVSHDKKKKKQIEERGKDWSPGISCKDSSGVWGKEKDWSWKLLINENCFGRSISVIITCRWGQQIVCPWKPLFSTSAVPQHRQSLTWISPDSHHKANCLEPTLLPKMWARKKSFVFRCLWSFYPLSYSAKGCLMLTHLFLVLCKCSLTLV